MTKQEMIMYQVLGKLYEVDAPIVFKGALITKLILMENSYAATERQTRDIDANWIEKPPSMEELVEVVNNSLKSLGDDVYAVAKRPYGQGKSAGIWIISRETGEQVFTMDIAIKPVIGSRVYHYGETSIRGVVPEAVLCDKISVISSERIFRRAKDLLDVYALSNCMVIRLADIYSALKKADRELGAFDAFTNRRADLEYAYNKMRGVTGKPGFNVLFSYLVDFLKPFMQRDMNDKVWIGGNASWCENVEKESK